MTANFLFDLRNVLIGPSANSGRNHLMSSSGLYVQLDSGPCPATTPSAVGRHPLQASIHCAAPTVMSWLFDS
jgi:hypothetical protein